MTALSKITLPRTALSKQNAKVSLNGSWSATLADGRTMPMHVPGCWDAHIPEKDWTGPVRFETSLIAAPEKGARCLLRFERVSYFCEVLVNGVLCGAHEGMWDAFLVDITDALREGENALAVLVTKPGYGEGDRFPLRQVLSGFIPDVLCTFGGIYGAVTAEMARSFAVEHHGARGQGDGSFRLMLGLADLTRGTEPEGAGEPVTVRAHVLDPQGAEVWRQEARLQPREGIEISGQIASPIAWSPENPVLYRYECELERDGQTERIAGGLGLRTLRTEGHRMLLGDTPLYLRGILHWGLYDRAIVPTPTAGEIEGELAGIRAYGFNAIKHCLYLPTEEYLTACDRAGVLQWVELPLWLPEPNAELEPRIRREYPRMLRALAGHPSVVMISLGCELDRAVEQKLLREMYELTRVRVDALVCDNSGSGECYGGNAVASSDIFDYHFYADLPNLEPLIDMFTPGWRTNKPWVFGEFCDSDTLRDLAPVRAAYGQERVFWEGADPHRNPISILKPDFTAHFHDERMESSDIQRQYQRLHQLSLHHTMTHRKTTLEMTRSFPELSGYNITALRDIPLSAIGLFDDMGRPKLPVEAFASVNGALALLPAWDLTRMWWGADRPQPRERYSYWGGQATGVHVLLSNFSTAVIVNPRVRWSICEGERMLFEGELRADRTLYPGEVAEVGVVRQPLPEVDLPQAWVLRVCLAEGDARNEWPLFVYPNRTDFKGKLGLLDPAGLFSGQSRASYGSHGGLEIRYALRELREEEEIAGVDVVIATVLSGPVRRFAERGGRVLFIQRGTHGALPVTLCPFWREGMIDRAGEHFLGALPDRHYTEDLRYWSVGTDTAFDFEGFALAGFERHEALMTRYDCRSWLRHAYVAALGCGQGCILATTLRLEGGMGKQPEGLEANVFGRWFIDQALCWLGERR